MRSGITDASDLPLHAWEALPPAVRVQHRLAEILLLLGDLRAELDDETAGALRWLDPEVDCVAVRVESILGRLAY